MGALLTAMVLGGAIRAGAGQLLSPEGFVLVDGKPRFVLGMYELPADDGRLAQLATSGFNLVRASDVASLDRLRAKGLMGWLCISPALEQGNDAQRLRLIESIQKGKDHPSLLAWELPDEALWNVWYSRDPWAYAGERHWLDSEIRKASNLSPEKKESLLSEMRHGCSLVNRGLWKKGEAVLESVYRQLGKADPHPELKISRAAADAVVLTEAMARGCAVVRRVDPKHVLWQNHAPRNTLASLGRYNAMVDVAGCDIYPAPAGGNGHSDLLNITLSSVGAYTDRMRASAPGKANWMVLQGFGWRDLHEGRKSADPEQGRRPTFQESRFMAYDAIVHGANGILYWGTYVMEKDNQVWRDLMKIAREIRALEPALVGGRPQKEPVVLADENAGSIDPNDGPRLILRRSGKDWVLIAVNEYRAPVPFHVAGLEALEGKTLYLLGSDEKHQVTGGQIQDGIASYGVHVYATSRQFEAAAR